LSTNTSDGRGGEPSPLTPNLAAVLYLLVTLAFTWPLVRGLTRDIPWDLGDPLLNSWILAWNADYLLRVLSGDVTAFRALWNANIFHPEPLTLAYSEHLFAQSAQILPVYALTGNIILSYNLLFLSTFVLSGLGMFLFVREVTGDSRAAFLAGLIYAFAPYRVPQFSHLQVLSSQWMPFVLYGLRRYFADRAVVPLVGAGAALVAQNLSNGYFLLFFFPFVVAYVLFEIATRNLWRDARVWTALGVTAAAVGLVTLPFLLPYLELRRLGVIERSINEVAIYSADVYSYLTTAPESRLWGRVMRAFPRSEGDLFPGITALLLAATGLTVSIREAWRAAIAPRVTGARRTAVQLLVALSALSALAVMVVLSGYGVGSIGPLPISVRRLERPSLILAAATGLLVLASPRARSFARIWGRTIPGFVAVALVLTFLLSLGLSIRSNGRLIGEPGPYSFLYSFVPGFDGLRVPARYGMVFLVFLSTAAGFGAAVINRRVRNGAALIVPALLVVAEGFAAPIGLNGTAAEGGYAPPPPRVYTGDEVPTVYRFLRGLPQPGTVVVEFPFGETAYELRYVFYSAHHWHPLLNGYSGAFPLSYSMRGLALRYPLNTPDFAWKALLEGGATHAIVHGGLYLNDEGQRISDWFQQRGAKLIADLDGDLVYELR
jgi:hypothetical protein